jgi:hypothetical protein
MLFWVSCVDPESKHDTQNTVRRSERDAHQP